MKLKIPVNFSVQDNQKFIVQFKFEPNKELFLSTMDGNKYVLVSKKDDAKKFDSKEEIKKLLDSLLQILTIEVGFDVQRSEMTQIEDLLKKFNLKGDKGSKEEKEKIEDLHVEKKMTDAEFQLLRSYYLNTLNANHSDDPTKSMKDKFKIVIIRENGKVDFKVMGVDEAIKFEKSYKPPKDEVTAGVYIHTKTYDTKDEANKDISTLKSSDIVKKYLEDYRRYKK